MNVFLGVGAYAWFDFSPEALGWSKQVALELWRRYGRHPSFYGWYVSAEAYGSLIPDQGESEKDRYRQQVDRFLPRVPGLLPEACPGETGHAGPQCSWHAPVPRCLAVVLKHLDIVCPFAFHRMPAGDCRPSVQGRGLASKHKDARPDDGADAQSDQVQRAQGALKRVRAYFTGLMLEHRHRFDSQQSGHESGIPSTGL